MAESLSIGPIHHVALRVTERDRSAVFYQMVCGFDFVAALLDVTLLSNRRLIMDLRDQPTAGGRTDFLLRCAQTPVTVGNPVAGQPSYTYLHGTTKRTDDPLKSVME